MRPATKDKCCESIFTRFGKAGCGKGIISVAGPDLLIKTSASELTTCCKWIELKIYKQGSAKAAGFDDIAGAHAESGAKLHKTISSLARG